MNRSFINRLEWSESVSQYLNYFKAVNHWWPNVVNWERVKNSKEQKNGIDLRLFLVDGKIITIQLKSRRKDYNDFLIEYEKQNELGWNKKGWIYTTSADVLLWFTPKKAYKIDFKKLFEIWESNKESWLENYKQKPSNNYRWKNWNCPIPWKILEEKGLKYSVFEIKEKVKTEDEIKRKINELRSYKDTFLSNPQVGIEIESTIQALEWVLKDEA